MGNFFTETLVHDPRFHSTEMLKDPALLEPNTRRKVEAIIADAKSGGHNLVIGETFRSQTRQQQLFDQGATELEHVGVHGYGGACDLWFLKPDGSVNWEADYSVLRDLARNHNLISGLDWGQPDRPHNFRDPDHVQFCSVADQEKLFSGEWYPPEDGSYNPFEHL